MEIIKKIAEGFKLNDETWLRHANPWSVWTRFVILPLLILAIWSRVWLGWYSLIPVIIITFWTWINPRAFGKPKSTNHWSSKAVFGERVWINKKEHPIPEHHTKMILILNIMNGSGLPFLIYGLYYFQIWPTILGLILVYLGKMWFLDRMVWLYEDMKHIPKYKKWLI